MVSLATFGAAVLAYQRQPSIYGVADRFSIGGSKGLAGFDLVFMPSTLLQALVADERPTILEFEQVPIIEWGMEPRREPRRVPAVVIQAAFVHYYESVLEAIEAAHGSSREWHKWPDVLRFGRAVRNAFTHDGRVYAPNRTAPAATWRGLTYGPAQHGREVIYNDLFPADLVILMEEMDAAF